MSTQHGQWNHSTEAMVMVGRMVRRAMRGMCAVGVAVCVMLAMASTAAAQDAVQKIKIEHLEELMSAIQERWYRVSGTCVIWPSNDNGLIPSAYPGPGFYGEMSSGKTTEVLHALAAAVGSTAWHYLREGVVAQMEGSNGVIGNPVIGGFLNSYFIDKNFKSISEIQECIDYIINTARRFQDVEVKVRASPDGCRIRKKENSVKVAQGFYNPPDSHDIVNEDSDHTSGDIGTGQPFNEAWNVSKIWESTWHYSDGTPDLVKKSNDIIKVQFTKSCRYIVETGLLKGVVLAYINCGGDNNKRNGSEPIQRLGAQFSNLDVVADSSYHRTNMIKVNTGSVSFVTRYFPDEIIPLPSLPSGGDSGTYSYLSGSTIITVDWKTDDRASRFYWAMGGIRMFVHCVFDREIPAVSIEPRWVCPTECPCTIPGQSNAQSMVDNNQMSHIHDAVDWQVASSSGGGCVPCGGGASGLSEGDVPSVKLERFHRYKDQDWRGSFGPGVFLGHDVQVTFDAFTGTARFFDPHRHVAFDLTNDGTGTYHDNDYQSIDSLTLFDADGVQVVGVAAARWAVVREWDGRTWTFDVFTTDENPATTGFFCGRLVTAADRAGNAIALTYADADPSVATADLGGDRSRLWRIAAISDPTGRTASLTWTRACGQWVIATITAPDGGLYRYHYDTDPLVGLTRVDYPTGDHATFATAWDAAQGLQRIAMADAGADGIHRTKTLFLTGCGGLSGNELRFTTPPNRVRVVQNGVGETSYRNWIRSNGDLTSIYVYEGGGEHGTGTFLRYDTNDGIPVAYYRAIHFDLDKSFDTFDWELVQNYQADSTMRVGRLTQADGSYTTYDRDEAGNILSTVRHRPDGTSAASSGATWNAFRLPLTQTDEAGRVTSNSYDAAGNLLSRTTAVGTSAAATTSAHYNALGQVTDRTDANGHSTDYAYDAQHRLVRITEPADQAGDARPARRVEYDAAGRVKILTDAANRTVRHDYDARGRLTVVTYGDGSTEETVYGSGATANLVVKRKDRNGVWEERGYDAAGRLTTIWTGRGQDGARYETRTYLPGKDLVATTTVNGVTTEQLYDHRLESVGTRQWATALVAHTTLTVHPLVSYVPAGDGSAWARPSWWPAGVPDPLVVSPQTTSAIQAATAASTRVAWSIDDRGRRTWRLDDYNGNPVRTVRELTPGAVTLPIALVDQVTTLIALTRPTGANPTYAIDESAYDAAGQLTSRTDANGVVATYEYDGAGRLSAQIDADRLADGSLNLNAARTEFRYDAQGNRTRIIKPRSFTRNADGTFVASAVGEFATVCTYTRRNLLATQTEQFIPATGSTLPATAATVVFTYTPTGKKATESDPRNPAWIMTYRYGTCCDRLTEVEDAQGFITRYAYDNVGRVTAVTDPNGNAVSTTYDAQGRVRTRTDGTGATTTLTYDDDLTDGTGLDALYGIRVRDLGFGACAAGSAILTTTPVGGTTLDIRDGLGRTVRRVAGGKQ